MSDDAEHPRRTRTRRNRGRDAAGTAATRNPESRAPEFHTETLRVPGLPCPECGSRIILEPAALLARAPVQCHACGLTLTLNAERSAPALNALSQYLGSFEQAKTRFEQTVERVSADPGAPKERPKGRGRRAPGRRQRRRR
jgi:transcription elongation factor Elf1